MSETVIVEVNQTDRPTVRPRQIEAEAAGRPDIPPGAHGDLASASVEHVADIVVSVWPGGSPPVRSQRRVGVLMLLDHLATFPGSCWTDRWVASGLDDGIRELADVEGPPGRKNTRRSRITSGLRSALSLRVFQPSLAGLRANRIMGLAETLRTAEADSLLDEFHAAVNASRRSAQLRANALIDVTAALLTQGIALADLTPEALLHYSLESRRLGVTPGAAGNERRYAGSLAWEVLHQLGHFPPGSPHTLKACLSDGQRGAAQLVDRHQIRNPSVRRLLIDYLERRRIGCDYSTWSALALRLVGLFWKAIEEINPTQADLHLSEHTYEQWRERLRYRNNGRLRERPESVLNTVRSFYLDLQTWSIEEPERWAQRAAPCPIPPQALSSSRSTKRRVSDRIADRIRVRQPLLRFLVEHVDDRRIRISELLTAASRVRPGDRFTHNERAYRRTDTAHDRQARLAGDDTVRVVAEAAGETTNLSLAEEDAFWDWAIVETMRHAGVRVEELLELTQLSIRQYERPNGEVIALLVIAPSKTDRERVIPMSAELFHVIAMIIRRHTTDERTVPVTRRYDPHERIWSPAMPFLFQHRLRSRGVFSFAAIRQMLGRICDRLADSRPEFRDLRFTPHDFRRLFATDLVNNGFPIHIGAQLLGHLNLQTTQGYVAVFEEDMVRHYQDFLARRRTLRPGDEYDSVTEQEWGEFEEHFDKRKVELGSCARPYGTACEHEHACIRCPMLNVYPKMLPRLQELQTDLAARRKRAAAEGWIGEIEGIDLTLRFLAEKEATAQRLAKTISAPVHLGLPTSRLEARATLVRDLDA